MKTLLEQALPYPRLVETNVVELAAPPNKVWEKVRHGDLGESSSLARLLFAARTLDGKTNLSIDNLRSTLEAPGFQVLAEEAPHEFVVGAIGKVWQFDIPFVHVPDALTFTIFGEPDFIKVAWSIRIEPLGASGSRLAFEVRVDATSDAAWERFRRYFRVIGIGSRLVRRSLLRHLQNELGAPDSTEEKRALAGDDFLHDATAQVTHAITISAPPDRIWPWLVQMGSGRGGFYAYDTLDNGGRPSAREIHPDLQRIAVGDILPTQLDNAKTGFEVLSIERDRALVVGGLFDLDAKDQLPFSSSRPSAYWHATWAFDLEQLDDSTTRLHVRARVAYPRLARLQAHGLWIRLVHEIMQSRQLRRVAALAEGRAARDTWRDVLDAFVGVAAMTGAFLTPFLAERRSHWGADEALKARVLPGDDLVREPQWTFTHAIEIDAPADEVWPWIAQIGSDRGGFYSYQALENFVGCELKNSEAIHPEWAIHLGMALRLHPNVPPLPVVDLIPGRAFVVYGAPDLAAKLTGKSWTSVSWLFLVEPIDGDRSRFVSRYRCAHSDDLATRLRFGPTLLEPISFAMDRRMLLGVKERAEAHTQHEVNDGRMT